MGVAFASKYLNFPSEFLIFFYMFQKYGVWVIISGWASQ